MTNVSNPDRGSRLVLGLIAGLPLTMILAASWLWYFVVEGDLDLIGVIGTANNGILVEPPRQLSTSAFVDDTGAALAWSDIDPRWTLLIPVAGATCDANCERRLYFTRQIHIALGKEFNKVRRVYLSDTPIPKVNITPSNPFPEGWPPQLSPELLTDYLVAAHKGLIPVSTDPDNFSALFTELIADPEQWYLVDPGGWIMMRYPDTLDYKQVIADLKFLLKNSGGGS